MAQIDDVRRDLEVAGFKVTVCERLPNDQGDQLRCRGGEVVNVYDSGKVLVQGQNQAQVRAALGLGGGGGGAPKKTPVSRKVFVVYGHDATARTELEAMLRRWGLDPIILDQLPSEGATLIEKLERYMSDDDVRFAIVLATPDDEGYPRGKTDERRYRARQNVVLELGILLSLLGRARVAILLKDQTNMERPSDIQGLVYLPFTENVEDAKVNLAKEMQAQGIDIHVAKL
jgi:predicted nucleotide-binding protein